MDKILKRSEKIAFYGIESGNQITYTRMRGFTEFAISKNPVEYSRRYIDENTERSDVVGYAPSISYSFDKFSDDDVHADIAEISDNELTGCDAIRHILLVDMSGTSASKPAIDREWSVVPDSEGNDTDAYTYSGTLKSNGDTISGTASSSDDWQTCTFTV